MPSEPTSSASASSPQAEPQRLVAVLPREPQKLPAPPPMPQPCAPPVEARPPQSRLIREVPDAAGDDDPPHEPRRWMAERSLPGTSVQFASRRSRMPRHCSWLCSVSWLGPLPASTRWRSSSVKPVSHAVLALDGFAHVCASPSSSSSSCGQRRVWSAIGETSSCWCCCARLLLTSRGLSSSGWNTPQTSASSAPSTRNSLCFDASARVRSSASESVESASSATSCKTCRTEPRLPRMTSSLRWCFSCLEIAPFLCATAMS
mmetsp:Transcript_85314/g.241685  ORF Transcript_85314/g.241685 Transcript_85314/m.241685 type:complete len:261 (-) Transcript_85314:525-1307(-)